MDRLRDSVSTESADARLAPLRPLLTQRARRSAELEELQETALRYDALVVFPRFHRATPIVPLPMPVGQ